MKIVLHRDSCTVHCTFYVETEKDQILTLAFPDRLEDFELLSMKNARGVKDFKVNVNGKPVKHGQWGDSSTSFGRFYNNNWFRFEAPILKGQLNVIECRYKDEWHESYSYLIGTGITWPGGIGRGRVVFDHSRICSRLFVCSPEYFRQHQDRAVPQKITPEMHDDSLVYSFSDYKPDSSEVVSIKVFPFWTDSTEFLSEDPLYNIPFYSWEYNWENRFLFEFLPDTVNFAHNLDYGALRADIVRHKGKGKRLSAGEKTALRILSGNVDSLRSRIISGLKLTGNATLTDVNCTGDCESRELERVLEQKIGSLNQAMNRILPVYMEGVEGELSVSVQTVSLGKVKEYDYKSSMPSKQGAKTILDVLGITQSTLLNRFQSHQSFEFTLRIDVE